MKKILVGLSLSLSCFFAVADSMECVNLQRGSVIKLELKADNLFDNCFALSNIPANTDVQVVTYSATTARNKISVFEIDSYGSSNYIAEYASNAEAGNAFAINTTNRNLVFRVNPISNTSLDKNISVGYLYFDGAAQVTIELNNIGTESSDTRPIGGGECTARGCFDER